ncbi:MAG: hypothetical protein U1B78_03385, partial [Dehalococcoidia bacterium]|nr:hypothetical protein [Dehalococcoidia bacterium]
MLRRIRLLPLPISACALIAAMAFVPACDGDDAADTATAPSPEPTAVATAPAGVAPGGPALPFGRYHYAVTVTLREDNGGDEVVVTTEGEFQSPDRHAFTHTTRVDGVAVKRSLVLIGDQSWFRTGDGSWKTKPPGDDDVLRLLSVAFTPVRPQFLGGHEFEQVRESVRRLPSTEDSVNGVLANHYRVGPEGREFFEAILGESGTSSDPRYELWLAQDGEWPVRLLAGGTFAEQSALLDSFGFEAPATWELRIDISQPDDPTI